MSVFKRPQKNEDIRKLMHKNGITFKDLATFDGCSSAQITKILKQDLRPQLKASILDLIDRYIKEQNKHDEIY